MMFATSFFEWLYKLIGKKRLGNKFYRGVLWTYQHLKYLSKNSLNKYKQFYINSNVRLFYFNGAINFGDRLNIDLMNYLSVDYVPVSIEEANCLCIGSILDELLLTKSRTLRYSSLVHIFGTGFMMCKEDPNERFNRPVRICALRGKLSLERCKALQNSSLEDVVLGDPGLLVKRMFSEIRKEHCYDVGIICHMKDKDSPYLSKINLKEKSVIFIDISQATRDFVSQVNQCDFILSSALHGLICADAFGIPNRWLVISGNVEGGDYKFRDYYSVYESITMPQPVDLREEIIEDRDVDRFKEDYVDVSPKIVKICDELEREFRKIIENVK